MNSSLTFENFQAKYVVALFVFCSTASSCILNISNSEMLASLCRPLCFVWIIHYFTPYKLKNAQLLRDSKPVRLLETPRSRSEYVLTMDLAQKTITNSQSNGVQQEVRPYPSHWHTWKGGYMVIW